jgi:hypothetical protein
MATNVELALEQPPQDAFDWLLVAVLSMTAGAVDVIGFLRTDEPAAIRL